MSELPRELRRWLCQFRRAGADWLTLRSRRIVSVDTDAALAGASFPERLSLEQPILQTEFVSAKIHNIRLARARIQNLPVPPEGIFSFWRLVGPSTAARGFLPGRSLLGGQLRPDYGGGLCQLSGLIYYVSLLAGLEILERHPHSVDIYTDENRYAPLGADATVAYGFKDLRIRNVLLDPACFRVVIQEDRIRCSLCSCSVVPTWQVEFIQTANSNGMTVVQTRRKRSVTEPFKTIAVSQYQALVPAAGMPR